MLRCGHNSRGTE